MKSKKLHIVLWFLCVSISVHSQYGVPQKLSTMAVVSASHAVTVNDWHISWSAGEPIIFTGAESQVFLTQGFHQPMVCKATPVISAHNQTSCVLPYVLSVTSVFHVYRWYLGNSFIANAPAHVYNPVQNGNHRVLVGDSTGCVLFSELERVDLSAKNSIPTVVAQGTPQWDTLLVSSPAASYQWFVVTPDNVHRAIVGETSQNYRPYYNGVYYVKVHTHDECVSVSDYFVVNNTGWDNIIRHDFEKTDSTIKIIKINFFTRHKLKVWPIPAHQNINIEYESPELNTVALQIFDVKGVMVHSKSIKNEKGKIETQYNNEHLPTGKYILKVIDGDKHSIQSMIFE